VVAIDPSSPFSGGALLGDRVRMQQHSGDPDVFIRSMANRGRLGGIAAGTEPAVAILAAAGYDPVIVETVGVGQAELEVVNLADTVVVVVAPTFGDDVSAAKAGLFEIGDVYCVNQADRGEAGAAISRLRAVVSADSVGGGQPPIVVTSALTGEGVEELWEAVSAHRAASPRSGGGGRPRKLGLGGS
jgi:LAO/AO transport system kinase